MKHLNWKFLLVSFLLALSAFFYLLQIELFHKPGDTAFYFFQDLAFVPIQVLLVTLIINRLLVVREKRATLNKLNMIVGVFFSEIGVRLMTYFYRLEPRAREIEQSLWVREDWTRQQLIKTGKLFKKYPYQVTFQPELLEELRSFLLGKRELLLRLLENPNLLEHDTFTDLLLAVFHLHDELTGREQVTDLPEKDRAHLSGDIKRAMQWVVSEWFLYLRHLKENYPYLYSLEVRRNPFDPQASIYIKK
ncbi:MAG: hypothetical protein HY892_04155 [Deltaproteobacteria bacterium]|nr:hypothetical protein [Deltaproteobacteria bacterium]